MKKLFNDNAKTIAIVALIGCVVLAVLLSRQKKQKKSPALGNNPQTTYTVNPAAKAESDVTAPADEKNKNE